MFEFKSLGADTAAYHSTRRTPAAGHLLCLIFYHMPPVCQTTLFLLVLPTKRNTWTGPFCFRLESLPLAYTVVLSLGNNYSCRYELLWFTVDGFCLRKRSSNSFVVIVLTRHVFHRFYARRLDNDKTDWFALSRACCNRKKNRNDHSYVLYA